MIDTLVVNETEESSVPVLRTAPDGRLLVMIDGVPVSVRL